MSKRTVDVEPIFGYKTGSARPSMADEITQKATTIKNSTTIRKMVHAHSRRISVFVIKVKPLFFIKPKERVEFVPIFQQKEEESAQNGLKGKSQCVVENFSCFHKKRDYQFH